MDKIDFKAQVEHLYKPFAKEVVGVDVPEFQFVMIDGEGDPNISERYYIASRGVLTGKHHEI